MKFYGYLLQEWLDHEDEEDDDAVQRLCDRLLAAHADYTNYLDSLPDFPEDLRPISLPFLVDDALFVRALYEPTKSRIKLILRCGNIPDGYFDLVLDYNGVEISEHDLKQLARAARGAWTARRYSHDAYCHELDLLPGGRIDHGFLFHGSWDWLRPDQWERVLPVMFTIRCMSLTWERIERPDRKLPRLKDRFRMV